MAVGSSCFTRALGLTPKLSYVGASLFLYTSIGCLPHPPIGPTYLLSCFQHPLHHPFAVRLRLANCRFHLLPDAFTLSLIEAHATPRPLLAAIPKHLAGLWVSNLDSALEHLLVSIAAFSATEDGNADTGGALTWWPQSVCACVCGAFRSAVVSGRALRVATAA